MKQILDRSNWLGSPTDLWIPLDEAVVCESTILPYQGCQGHETHQWCQMRGTAELWYGLGRSAYGFLKKDDAHHVDSGNVSPSNTLCLYGTICISVSYTLKIRLSRPTKFQPTNRSRSSTVQLLHGQICTSFHTGRSRLHSNSCKALAYTFEHSLIPTRLSIRSARMRRVRYSRLCRHEHCLWRCAFREQSYELAIFILQSRTTLIDLGMPHSYLIF